MTRVRTAVLISGRGSNLKSLIAACARRTFRPRSCLCSPMSRAREGSPSRRTRASRPRRFRTSRSPRARRSMLRSTRRSRRQRRARLRSGLHAHPPRGSSALDGRILNIHPSLLPKFPGVRVHEQVLAAGETESGCTVHFIDRPNSTPDRSWRRPRAGTHRRHAGDTCRTRARGRSTCSIPQALRLVAEGRVRLENGKAVAVV